MREFPFRSREGTEWGWSGENKRQEIMSLHQQSREQMFSRSNEGLGEADTERESKSFDSHPQSLGIGKRDVGRECGTKNEGITGSCASKERR